MWKLRNTTGILSAFNTKIQSGLQIVSDISIPAGPQTFTSVSSTGLIGKPYITMSYNGDHIIPFTNDQLFTMSTLHYLLLLFNIGSCDDVICYEIWHIK